VKQNIGLFHVIQPTFYITHTHTNEPTHKRNLSNGFSIKRIRFWSSPLHHLARNRETSAHVIHHLITTYEKQSKM